MLYTKLNSKKLLEIILFQLLKLEVYKVGDTVQILENARECEDYDTWNNIKKAMVGKIFKISSIKDKSWGLTYVLDDFYFPAYCIDKIEKELEPKTEPQTIKIGGDTYSVTPELLTALSNLKKI